MRSLPCPDTHPGAPGPRRRLSWAGGRWREGAGTAAGGRSWKSWSTDWGLFRYIFFSFGYLYSCFCFLFSLFLCSYWDFPLLICLIIFPYYLFKYILFSFHFLLLLSLSSILIPSSSYIFFNYTWVILFLTFTLIHGCAYAALMQDASIL